MKRHQQLQPLSRQHHNGLLMTLLIKKGLKKKAPLSVINDFISKGWDEELKEHFEMEESILLPVLRQNSFDPLLIDQLIFEHKQIRLLVEKASVNQAIEAELETFALLLEKHIRFEEKVFFPKAEEVLTEKELTEIGNQLHEDRSKNCINYPIKFWE
jgi:hemerythrin-like domain-containing protein